MEDQIVAARVAALRNLLPEWTANPSESVYKNMESSAYRETILRQYFNERALSLLLPYATGSDLDAIGATRGLLRQVDESDARFRYRIATSQAVVCATTLDGIRGIAHNVNSRVYDVQPIRRANRLDVDVYVLLTDGAADAALIAEINTTLNSDHVRPIQSDFYAHHATVLPFRIDLNIRYDPRRATAEVVQSNARTQLYALIDQVFRLGQPVTAEMVIGASITEGWVDASLVSPLEASASNVIYDLFPTDAQVYRCAKTPPVNYTTADPPVPLDGVRITTTVATVIA